MESYLNENFEVKPKNSSEEVLQRWRDLCGVVKNPKRRFRFTANLSKRFEAAAMRRTNQVPSISYFLSFLLEFLQDMGIKKFFFLIPMIFFRDPLIFFEYIERKLVENQEMLRNNSGDFEPRPLLFYDHC